MGKVGTAKFAAGLVAAPVAMVSFAWALRAEAGPQKAVAATGQQIYAQQCAVCHGAKGQGAKAYPKPLTGTRSVNELSRFIAQTMPPGPKKCPAPMSKKVADYIYTAFYSPQAQARNKPMRPALSRLTVKQFRNALTDLVSGFHAVVPEGEPTGLRGEYFKDRNFDDKERLIERVDSQVSFDFGTQGPIPDKFDPHHFSVAWSGSVFAPDTGEYEFVFRTEHSGRLWVNGEEPLIDASIKSGSDTEYHGFINLIGGRAYGLRLEFTKSTQGVDDSKDKKGKPAPKASVALLWKRPKQALELIPQRCLYPTFREPVYIASTPFPPDDRSMGYERGTTISKAWDEATTSAALETAHYVADHLRQLSDVKSDDKERKEKLTAYCRQFVERAIRRPLTPDIEKRYITRQFSSTPDADTAVKRCVALAVKSPLFLYRELDERDNDPYATASRLSFGLWDSLPDSELLKAAKEGRLATRDQIMEQAKRMVSDSRSWTKLRDFLLLWLKVDQAPELAKNAAHYPDFDATAASDLRTSLELFLQSTAWGKEADYRELMQTPTLYLNGRLAKMYGVNLPADAPFQAVKTDAKERAGVLTQPYLLSCLAYVDGSSPIHRGVLIARNMLGRVLSPPPAAFVPLAASAYPNMTTRQRVSLQTKPAACIGCHGMINPLGFTLEKYDAIGRVRTTEKNQPIDDSGSYRARDGKLVKFSGADDLGKYLAESDEAQSAFVEKLFHHLVKQPVLAYGTSTLPDLQQTFGKNQYNIRKLMVEIMAETALPHATTTAKTPGQSSVVSIGANLK